jgi:hypothetical protein
LQKVINKCISASSLFPYCHTFKEFICLILEGISLLLNGGVLLFCGHAAMPVRNQRYNFLSLAFLPMHHTLPIHPPSIHHWILTRTPARGDRHLVPSITQSDPCAHDAGSPAAFGTEEIDAFEPEKNPANDRPDILRGRNRGRRSANGEICILLVSLLISTDLVEAPFLHLCLKQAPRGGRAISDQG